MSNLIHPISNQENFYHSFYTYLGQSTVSKIKEVKIQEIFDTTIPQPWKDPKELPDDIVMGVLPKTKRPILALRYGSTSTKTICLEIFFPLKNSQSNIWLSNPVNCPNQRICPAAGVHLSFILRMVKSILECKSLTDTFGRYLPKFKDKFNHLSFDPIHSPINNEKQEVDKFKYLKSMIGEELVNEIPTINIECHQDTTFPSLWKKPEDLPFDVVKFILPLTKRPGIAFRYYENNSKNVTHSVRYYHEIYFQFYMQPELENKWMGTNSKNLERPIYHTQTDLTATFKKIAALFRGGALKETDGKYLPKFKNSFTKDIEQQPQPEAKPKIPLQLPKIHSDKINDISQKLLALSLVDPKYDDDQFKNRITLQPLKKPYRSK